MADQTTDQKPSEINESPIKHGVSFTQIDSDPRRPLRRDGMRSPEAVEASQTDYTAASDATHGVSPNDRSFMRMRYIGSDQQRMARAVQDAVEVYLIEHAHDIMADHKILLQDFVRLNTPVAHAPITADEHRHHMDRLAAQDAAAGGAGPARLTAVEEDSRRKMEANQVPGTDLSDPDRPKAISPNQDPDGAHDPNAPVVASPPQDAPSKRGRS